LVRIVVDWEAHVGKGDQFSELDTYLEDQQRGKKRSLSEIEKVGTWSCPRLTGHRAIVIELA